MSHPAPTETLATEIASRRLGWATATARRFTTGSAHYVYEVACGAELAVVRLGMPDQAAELANGVLLARQLGPLGVPLAPVLSEGTDAPLPYVILARLPGTDLGDVIGTLSPQARHQVARSVAEAQRATGRLGLAAGFGYAPNGMAASHRRWSDVVVASIERSRRRIAANGLFPKDAGDPLLAAFERQRPALDAIAPVPFLHDTTTKNVIVTPEGRLSGIVDVDDLCFGDSRYAAALTEAALIAWGGPLDYVLAWMSHAELVRDSVFDLYVAIFLLDFMGEHGMAFNGNALPSEASARNRLARHYAAALGRLR